MRQLIVDQQSIVNYQLTHRPRQPWCRTTGISCTFDSCAYGVELTRRP